MTYGAGSNPLTRHGEPERIRRYLQYPVGHRHDEEADDSPEHVLLALRSIPARGKRHKKLHDAPDKDEERGAKEERGNGVEDGADERVPESLRSRGEIAHEPLKPLRRVLDRRGDELLSAGLYSQGVADNADDAPDGYHNEERDDARYHYFAALFMTSFAARAADVLDETPEEDDQGYRDEERNDQVDDVEREVQEVGDIPGCAATRLRKRNRR